MGCCDLVEKDWDEEDYFDEIMIGNWTHCNCDCVYCYTAKDKQFYNTQKTYNILPVIEDMFDKNLIRSGGEISFGGGEPTLLEEFEDLVNIFIDKKLKMRVHSSGIKYSPAIERGLKEDILTLVISIDSGDEKTFKKIKEVQSYNKVVENIKKYQESLDEMHKHNLVVKYIIIPGYNDSIKSIDNFFEMIVQTGVKHVSFDIEILYLQSGKKLSKHIYMLMDYIKYRAKQLDLIYSMYDAANYAEQNRKIPTDEAALAAKHLYRFIFNWHKLLNTMHNIKYR